MKRRDFLSLCGLAAGSCLVPDAIARAIRDACVLAERPYLVLPRDPSSVLYAYSGDGKTDFMLHMGDAHEYQIPPTWREHRSARALGADRAHARPVRARRAGASESIPRGLRRG